MKRLNLITDQLAITGLPSFLINGLKREQLIASNSMIVHDLFFDGLTWAPRDRRLTDRWAMDHATMLVGGTPILALDMYEHSYHMVYGAQGRDLCRDLYGSQPLEQCRSVVRCRINLKPWCLVSAPR